MVFVEERPVERGKRPSGSSTTLLGLGYPIGTSLYTPWQLLQLTDLRISILALLAGASSRVDATGSC
jgi:hypothetical protein